MRGTYGTFLRRSLIVAAVSLSSLAMTSENANATSTTSTVATHTVVCDVVLNPSVRVESKTTCIVRVRLGASARIELGSGFRWGYPVSTSQAVVLTSFTRTSVGVVGATLHAAAIGRAILRTTGTVYCKPGVACPDLALLWHITVIVSKTL